jgi:hypothetical protein
LYAAVQRAAERVPDPEKPKAIVVFTDGRNTVPGPSLDQVIRVCRQAKASVHVVALRTVETQESVLKQLAVQTGGTLAMEDAQTIARSLRSLAVIVATPIYRLVLPDTAWTQGDLRIQVGSRPETAITWRP